METGEMYRLYSFCCSRTRQSFSIKILATIIVCNLLISVVFASQQEANYNYNEQDYHYKNVGENSYSDNQEVDYSINDPIVEDEPHLCYSCEYSLLEDGHIEGYDGCNEPFVPDGLPEIQCKHPCSKKFEIHGKFSYTVRRMCTPNCRDRSIKGGGYTKCCTTNLCNGKSKFHSLRDRFPLVLVGVLLTILTVSWV